MRKITLIILYVIDFIYISPVCCLFYVFIYLFYFFLIDVRIPLSAACFKENRIFRKKSRAHILLVLKIFLMSDLHTNLQLKRTIPHLCIIYKNIWEIHGKGWLRKLKIIFKLSSNLWIKL